MEAIKISRHFIIIIYNSPILLPINLLLHSPNQHFCIIFANQLFLLHFLAMFFVSILCLQIFVSALGATIPNRSFQIDAKNNVFRKDGRPFRYIAGEIHYFRIHPSLWEDRLHRIRAAGLNAVQIYIPWSMHEPTPGNFNFTHNRDVVKFIRLAQQNDLFVLLRPGPYVGSELDSGGLPWWLVRDEPNGIVVRTSNQIFLNHVENYYSVLLPLLVPLLHRNGGPILMLQIENEYGSIRPGCDKIYLAFLRDLFHRHLGNDVLLYTSDGNGNRFLECGTVPGVYPTINFGAAIPFSALTESAAKSYFELQRKYSGGGPKVNSEFYTMWLSVLTDQGLYPQQIEPILKAMDIFWAQNVSFSFYMFHGGTNFGSIAGRLAAVPVTTSYDYSAPISESGGITPLYEAIRDWIGRLPAEDWPNRPLPIPPNPIGIQIEDSHPIKLANLFGLLNASSSQCISSTQPLNIEQFHKDHPFIWYKTILPFDSSNLTIPSFEDYAYIFLDEQFKGNLSICDNIGCKQSLPLNGQKGQRLDILVENAGRHTYPLTKIHRKGILSPILLDDRSIDEHQWIQCGIDVDRLFEAAKNEFKLQKTNQIGPKLEEGGPAIYVAKLPSNGATNWTNGRHTFFDSTGWGHGLALLNGFDLGRYWPLIGPQLTMFIPGAVMRGGEETENWMVLLELIGWQNSQKEQPTIRFLANPIQHFIKTPELATFLNYQQNITFEYN